MKKITFLFSLLCFSVAFSQVAIDEDFNSGTPAGWTDTYTNTATVACEGSSERVNIYEFNSTGNLTTSNQVGLSNGTDLDISFDYRILDYGDGFADPDTPTVAGWGTAELQYSTDDGVTWTTVLTINDSNHVVAYDCATMMATVPAASLPNGSDVKLQIINTWAAGDYYFYVDNFVATQAAVNPPNCDAMLVDVINTGDISWTAATGIPTGYTLTAGTTSGGNDLADNVDVGNVLTYNVGALTAGNDVFVTIVPYNDNGPATGCVEQSMTVPCSSPTVTYTVVNDCNVSGGFLIDVDITDMGSATSLTVSDDQGSTPQPVTGTGVVQFGPYANATDVVITVGHDQDGLCDTMSGTLTQAVCPPDNDTCAGVIDLGAETSPLTASTVGANNNFVVDCLTNTSAPDVVYSILVPNGSTIDIGQTSNSYDSKHRLAYGGSCPGDTLIACTDDPDTETLSWTNSTGSDQTVYWVQSAYTTGSGDYTLAWNVYACAPPVATYTVVNDCDVSGGFLIDVDVTDMGSATSLTVSDDQGSTPQPVTGTGVVQFGPYTNGTDVVITVGHDQDGLCDIMSGTLTQDSCPPANDDFANATPIDCSSGTIMGSTSLATLDEDDAPDGGGADMDAPNVWFSIDSSVDGASDVTINLCGSSYDTSVLIYTGTSGNLTFVAGNDDNTAACGQCCQSLVTFPTDGTSTYYIAVEGYNVGSTGDFEMVVSCVAATPPPANDECANAVPLTTGVTVSGTTVGATTSPGDAPTCDTFGSIADVWYSVEITGGTSDLSITTTITGTSDQANVAVYDDCGALAANSLGCSDANGGETLNVNGLAIGTYYVRVWSDGNAPPTAPGRVEGTFDIVVNATLSTGSFESETAFTYYPNPVYNTLTLSAQNTIENVVMYNILGQEVLRATPNTVNSELDMSSLQDGAYFVKVTIANITKTVRVIKQ